MDLRHDMLTHGVNIVAAQHEGERRGLAVAWGTQAATSRIVIAVGAHSATRELILGSEAFGLSVLAKEHLEIARLFGTQSSRDVDKFEKVAYHTAETGSPLLDDCARALDCRVEAVHDCDWAKLIVGRIVAAEQRMEEFDPLIYRQDDY
jgi:flavin reductase (DIM6/NTAB) family NADH-FMN oxidoreductase RutF